MSFRPLFYIGLLVLLAPGVASAASDDAQQIRATALDYIEGWYGGDPVRMERALHPEMLKRRVVVDPKTRESSLDAGDAARLIQATTPSPGRPARSLGVQRRDVRVLDVFGNAATVRIEADQWVDYLHLVRWNGDWKIIHVLWEMKDGG